MQLHLCWLSDISIMHDMHNYKFLSFICVINKQSCSSVVTTTTTTFI